MYSDFQYYESRATMCESILKTFSISTFFSDIIYETLLCKGLFFFRKGSFETKKKHFYLI